MISKTGIHAVRAVVALSELPEGAFAGAADIASRIGAPPNYLGKLLKNLAGEGLLESQKGKAAVSGSPAIPLASRSTKWWNRSTRLAGGRAVSWDKAAALRRHRAASTINGEGFGMRISGSSRKLNSPNWPIRRL